MEADLSGSTPELIHESEDWLVFSKPAGWITIPGNVGTNVDTKILSQWVQSRWPGTLVVHRLDRETSGVILFARNPSAHRRANLWFENRQIKKFYDCIAQGFPTMPVMKIKSPVRSQNALTQVEIQEAFEEAFLARARPMSGRRHQIRIHLSWAGHPLLGDAQYKGVHLLPLREGVLKVGRVALHAQRLELPTGLVFEAQWPHDFSAWVDELRRRGTPLGSL